MHPSVFLHNSSFRLVMQRYIYFFYICKNLIKFLCLIFKIEMYFLGTPIFFELYMILRCMIKI